MPLWLRIEQNWVDCAAPCDEEYPIPGAVRCGAVRGGAEWCGAERSRAERSGAERCGVILHCMPWLRFYVASSETPGGLALSLAFLVIVLLLRLLLLLAFSLLLIFLWQKQLNQTLFTHLPLLRRIIIESELS